MVHQPAEELWGHSAAHPWTATEPSPDIDRFEPDLFDLLQRAVPVGSTILTLAERRPNLFVDITEHGVYVETDRSRSRQAGAQLVPAWMLQPACDYLQRYGELSNRCLLAADGLNVKRSSAVCAVLARLPGINITSNRSCSVPAGPHLLQPGYAPRSSCDSADERLSAGCRRWPGRSAKWLSSLHSRQNRSWRPGERPAGRTAGRGWFPGRANVVGQPW